MAGRVAVTAARLETHFSDELLSLGPVPSPCHNVCPVRLLEWAAAPCWFPLMPHPILSNSGLEGKEDREEEVMAWPLCSPGARQA